MNTFSKITCIVLLLAISYSCKQGDINSTEAETALETVADSSAVSSVAAKVVPSDTRKVIRTAELKMKVKDVAKSTYVIENTVHKFGGFVTFTDLKSTINQKEETRVSQDSILETTKYTVENNLIIQIPNQQLDTVLQSLRKEINFLDARKITQDDISLQLLSNKMAQQRSVLSSKRIEKAIDNKGKKLNQIIESEDNLESKKEQNDNKTIENLALNDKVNFSTITISLYQREMMKNELFASEKDSNKFRPQLGFRIFDGLQSGWYLIESIVAFIAHLWGLLLIGILLWFGYKKRFKK